MVALEHLHADALLSVLGAAALALIALRLTVVVCTRARLARDLVIVRSRAASHAPSGRTGRTPTQA